MGNQDTIISRPLPKRPETGLLAWLATMGYISAEYSPDATLTLRATPSAQGVMWSARAVWGSVEEMVSSMPTLELALKALWKTIEAKHRIFKTLEAATKRPANYPEGAWVDSDTDETLQWLCELASAAFNADWTLMLIYRPVEIPEARAQARLLARGNTVHVSGNSATLREACVNLYRHAAPNYFTTP